MLVAYKYRLYPSGEALERLEYNLELARWVYNKLLEDRNNARLEGRRVSDFDQARLIIKLRETIKPELADCNARMLGQIPRRIAASIRALSELKKQGRVVGPIKFKKYGEYNTLEYNQSGFRIDVEHGTLELSKIGVIPARYHRPLPEGIVKGVLVKRDHDRWYAIVQVMTPDNVEQRSGNRRVELSFGLDYIVRDSDGLAFKHPHYYLESLGRIKRRQRELSRKKKGSSNRRKAVLKLGRAHNKAEEQRRDYLHWISRYYVDHYDEITIIKPDVSSILKTSKNPAYNRDLLDAGISRLIAMIEYKAARMGVKVTIKPAKTINRKNANMVGAGAGSADVPVE